MKIGPKYKIARRLGAPVFEKTQTQKFALSLARKGKGSSRPKSKTAFSNQLTEKQKARFFYCVSEKQFKKYVNNVLAKKSLSPDTDLGVELESRLDNVVYRLGLTPTRLAARQMVSHGHIKVGEKRITTPSYRLVPGDKLSVRDGSKNTALFSGVAEKYQTYEPPKWLKFDPATLKGSMVAVPEIEKGTQLFDLATVLEYYRR